MLFPVDVLFDDEVEVEVDDDDDDDEVVVVLPRPLELSMPLPLSLSSMLDVVVDLDEVVVVCIMSSLDVYSEEGENYSQLTRSCCAHRGQYSSLSYHSFDKDVSSLVRLLNWLYATYRSVVVIVVLPTRRVHVMTVV